MTSKITDPGQLAVDNVRSLAPYVPGKPIEELRARARHHATSSSWRRTRIRSGRARWRSPPCSARSPTPGCIPTAAATCSSRSWPRSSASTSTRSRSATAPTTCWCCWPRPSSKPGLEAVYSQYAFAVYPIAVQATGATGDGARHCRRIRPCRWATTSPPWRAPSRRARASCSSPTLTTRPAPGCQRASSKPSSPRCRAHVLVALDEAYFEYTGGLGAAGRHRAGWRAIRISSCSRTFSKAYGLAGVRVGYARQPSVGRRHAQSRAPGVQRVRWWVSPARRRRSTTPAHVAAAVKRGGRRARARGGAISRSRARRVMPSAGNFLLLHAGADAQRALRGAAAQRHHRAAGGQLPVARAPARHAGHGRTERSFPQRLGSLIAFRSA